MKKTEPEADDVGLRFFVALDGHGLLREDSIYSLEAFHAIELLGDFLE